jgi:hypothetical protein
MALAIDHGDPTAPLGPVHSRDKEPVASRLAATMYKLRGCVSDCAVVGDAATLSCNVPICGPHDEGSSLPTGDVLRASGPRLIRSVLVSFGLNSSVISLKFNNSAQLRFANTSLCNISQPVGARPGRRCCSALPDTMALCLGGRSTQNAPYDINSTSCFAADSVTIDPQSGTVEARATMPGPAEWVQWSADPYPECALVNDAGLPASPFASPLAPLPV